MAKVVINILQGSAVIQTVLDGLTQCICVKIIKKIGLQ